MCRNWNISQNKKVLQVYDRLNVKKLPKKMHYKGTVRMCCLRTNTKALYACMGRDNKVYYEVFINFVIPIPSVFLMISLYDHKEKYPSDDEFDYRAWIFTDKVKAMDKYESLE